MDSKELVAVIHLSLTSLAIVVGGGWALWKFAIRREDHPKIQFDIDLNILALQDEQIVFEVILQIENKGFVRHEIDANNFSVNIRYLLNNDKVIEGNETINFQTELPKSLKLEIPKDYKGELTTMEKRSGFLLRRVVPKSWGNTFVDPGVSQKYSYLCSVPMLTSVIMVKSTFKYADKESDFHGAQKAFSITQMLNNFHTGAPTT